MSTYRLVNLPMMRNEFTSTYDGSADLAYSQSIACVQMAGCPASTAVAKYTYSYVVEAISTLSTFKYAQEDLTSLAHHQSVLVDLLFRMFPALHT